MRTCHVLTIIIALSLIFTACASATEIPPSTPSATATVPEPTITSLPPGVPADRKEIRWLIGLGTGQRDNKVRIVEQVVRDFNTSQDELYLSMQLVAYNALVETLSSQVAHNKAPDIVGPLGWSESHAFHGQWLDLEPYITETKYNLNQFSQELVQYYKTDEGQIGLPFAVFPAAVFYQPSLFDKAGLSYPPKEYGEKYVMPNGLEVAWSWDTLAEVAKLLTIDINGRNSTEKYFDRVQLVQIGYEPQYQHTMHVYAFFGSGRLIDEANNAVIPYNFVDAMDWINNGVWGLQPFITSGVLAGSPAFTGPSGTFSSGRVAMAVTNSWYLCCLQHMATSDHEFQFAALPSYKENVSGRIDGMTFRILKSTKYPRETFEVLTYLIGSEASAKLLPLYDGISARTGEEQAWIETKSAEYPFITTWDTLIAGLAYPDMPPAEGYMTNFDEAWNRIGALMTRIRNIEDYDLSAEINDLRIDLDAIYKR